MKEDEIDENSASRKNAEDAIKKQYDKLANDWRHFNTILWGVPSVAVAIMTGVIVGSYRPELEGWPRIVALSVGSLFLFALAIEVVKKRDHMNVISYMLKEIQDQLLPEKFRFPVGISDDIEKYIDKYVPKPTEKYLPDYNDPLFRGLKRFYARKTLTYVIFVAAIAVGMLAVSEVIQMALKTMQVDIDTEPGSDSNATSPKSNGKIPVAILSTSHFDTHT